MKSRKRYAKQSSSKSKLSNEENDSSKKIETFEKSIPEKKSKMDRISMKIISWNIAGMKSWLKVRFLILRVF